MENISDKIIDKIEKDNIHPDPRWKFFLRNLLLVLAYLGFTILGALAVSVVFYLISYTDWDIYENMGRGFWENILLSLPYIWVTLILLFFALAYFNFKNTKRGYKRNPFAILSGSVLGGIFLGALFFNLGIGRVIDEYLNNKVPFYCGCHGRMLAVWSSPEKGLLSGEVGPMKEGAVFTLLDFEGRRWMVKKERAIIRPRVFLRAGETVKIIGEMENKDIFLAKEIRPWNFKKERERLFSKCLRASER